MALGSIAMTNIQAVSLPELRIPASQTLNNDLVDERPMDEDELLDFADQEPLSSPTLQLYPISYTISYFVN
jgi:hypothetical protein